MRRATLALFRRRCTAAPPSASRATSAPTARCAAPTPATPSPAPNRRHTEQLERLPAATNTRSRVALVYTAATSSAAPSKCARLTRRPSDRSAVVPRFTHTTTNRSFIILFLLLPISLTDFKDRDSKK